MSATSVGIFSSFQYIHTLLRLTEQTPEMLVKAYQYGTYSKVILYTLKMKCPLLKQGKKIFVDPRVYRVPSPIRELAAASHHPR